MISITKVISTLTLSAYVIAYATLFAHLFPHYPEEDVISTESAHCACSHGHLQVSNPANNASEDCLELPVPEHEHCICSAFDNYENLATRRISNNEELVIPCKCGLNDNLPCWKGSQKLPEKPFSGALDTSQVSPQLVFLSTVILTC